MKAKHILVFAFSTISPLPLLAQDTAVLEDIVVAGERPTHRGVTENHGGYHATSSSAATKMHLSPKETPQNISVITHQLIKDKDLATIEDVVKITPGLSVRQLDSDRIAFNARGININNIMRDGVPIYYNTRFNYGDNALNTIIFDRIEIIKGAAGLAQGTGNPSAVINLVRKKPTIKAQGALGVGISRWGRWQTDVDVSGPINEAGSIRGRLVAAYANQDSFINRHKQFNYPFYGIIEADLSPDTLFTIGANTQRSRISGGMYGGLPIFYNDDSLTDYGRSDSTAPDWAYSDNDSRSFFTSLRHQLNEQWQVEGSFTYDHSKLTQNILWMTGSADPLTNVGTYPGSLAETKSHRIQRSIDLNLSGQYDLFGRQHQIVVGMNRATQSHVNDYYLPKNCALQVNCPIAQDFTQSGWHYPKPEWSERISYSDSGKDEATAYYASTKLSLADPLSLILGGRVASWKTDSASFGLPIKYDYRHKFLPYVGLLYDLTPSLTLYGSHTEIFEPSLARGIDFNILPPTSGKNHEIGIKGQANDGRLSYALSLFQIRQNNTPVRLAGVPPLPDNTAPHQALSGTKTQGFEAEVSGNLTERWLLFGGYTQYKNRDPNGDEFSTENPRQQFKLFTTYQLPGALHQLTIGGGVNWQSRIYSDVAAPSKQIVRVGQSSYALYDVMLRYQANKDLSFSLNAENLFDKTYYAQRGFHSQSYFGTPRNVTARMSYRF